MQRPRLRFGSFIAPHTPIDENPMVSGEYDLRLVEYIESLGFHEAWSGEHHSGGWETSASPEMMIAAASQRTSTIKLGTGVSSLPYHHPYVLADRIRQADYLSRGRAMFGVGPGSLPSDAYMMGISTDEVRDRMEQAIEPLVRLLRGETVTQSTDWFTLQKARLQLPSYCEDGVEMVVASQVSPTGARAAGKFGLGLLSIGATSAGAFNSLASNWGIAESLAKDHGQQVNRSQWRLVAPVHVAETREKARDNVRFALHKWVDYMSKVAALPLAPPPGVDAIDHMVDTGFAVIGTPDDYVEQIERLWDQSGGFGCFLHLETNWADRAETMRSYELIARYAIPKINQLNIARQESEQWLRENNEEFRGQLKAAVNAKIVQHAAEKGGEFISPDLASGIS